MIIQDGTTALMLASANNFLDCVKVLIEDGAEVGVQRQVSKNKRVFNSLLAHFINLLDRFFVGCGRMHYVHCIQCCTYVNFACRRSLP